MLSFAVKMLEISNVLGLILNIDVTPFQVFLMFFQSIFQPI